MMNFTGVSATAFPLIGLECLHTDSLVVRYPLAILIQLLPSRLLDTRDELIALFDRQRVQVVTAKHLEPQTYTICRSVKRRRSIEIDRKSDVESLTFEKRYVFIDCRKVQVGSFYFDTVRFERI